MNTKIPIFLLILPREFFERVTEMPIPQPNERVEVDLHPLLMQVVHLQKPFRQSRPPEPKLRLPWVLLDRVVVHTIVDLERE